jgi:3-methyladenine DNA glycosylase AlkD
MTANEILTMLSEIGNDKRKQMYIKNGASENTYGVLLGELRKIAKQIGKNHELAVELWQTGNTEARWLACMIMDVQKLSLKEVREMTEELTYNDLIDKFIGEVICYHKDAEILEREWTVSDKDNLGRAGWNLVVYRVSEGNESEEALNKILATVEAELQTASPGKQWAMNHAMCEIGICYPEYTERCMSMGERLGVYRDLKVPKGCTSAFAPNWITVVVNKKRK